MKFPWKKILKLVWKARNILQYLYIKVARQKNTGVFWHKKDSRDVPFVPPEGILVKEYLPPILFWHCQSPYNDCVLASRGMGMSNQEKFRVSVQWFCKVARKLGMITGEGYSYLRAGNEVTYKVGALPYVLMPDEPNGRSWEEYSKWTPEDEKLLAVAANFKVPGYFKVKTLGDALRALQNGYALFTASLWYESDSEPKYPKYLLTHKGQKIGAHAYYGDGFREYGDHVRNPETLGFLYGEQGVAYIEDLFASDHYDVYVQEFLPQSSHDYLNNVILKP